MRERVLSARASLGSETWLTAGGAAVRSSGAVIAHLHMYRSVYIRKVRLLDGLVNHTAIAIAPDGAPHPAPPGPPGSSPAQQPWPAAALTRFGSSRSPSHSE